MNFLLPAKTGNEGIGPLSELENGLRGPDAEKVRDQAFKQLDDLAQRLRQALAQGVNGKDYLRIAALQDACKAAREVLDSMATGH